MISIFTEKCPVTLVSLFFQFLCGNIYCLKDAFKCYHGYCYAKKQCTHNDHRPEDQYCDRYYQACRKGVRRWSHTQQCGYGLVCKGGCVSSANVLGTGIVLATNIATTPQESVMITAHTATRGTDNYCKSGYACVDS